MDDGLLDECRIEGPLVLKETGAAPSSVGARNNESSAANPYLKANPSICSSMAEWDGAIQSGEIPNLTPRPRPLGWFPSPKGGSRTKDDDDDEG